jgi:putative ABC transport system substrate-binding protein
LGTSDPALQSFKSARVTSIKALVPQATAVGLLVWPIPDIDDQTVYLRAAARVLGLTLHVVDVEREGGIEGAFAVLVQRRASALIVHPTSAAMINRHQLAVAAARSAIPTIYPARDFVSAGGLFSYGINFAEAGRQAGIYVGRILKGEKPSDLPIQRPTKFDFSINLKTSKALGIEFTPKLLALADEVIE